MKPTPKAPAIADLLNALADRDNSINTNKCVRKPIGCGLPIKGFNDPLSEKEYRISGLCQQCQDKVFG